MPIEQSRYIVSPSPYKKSPLMISCSGGSGHIIACLALLKDLALSFGDEIQFNKYHSCATYTDFQKTPLNQLLKTTKILRAEGIKKALHSLCSYLGLPALPDYDFLEKEIEALYEKQKIEPLYYIDMLLDVYSNSYVVIAIWNYLTRTEQTAALSQLVQFQSLSNLTHYYEVYNFFLELLKDTAAQGQPYTELVSTQAMGLPALCDAVIAYNKFLVSEKKSAPPVLINQYMTDLPTKGAEHFFKSLASLTEEQQKVINLYAVNLNEEIINYYFPKGHHFHGLFNIDPHNNPLVRTAFTNPQYDNSQKFHTDFQIKLSDQEFTLKENTKIATIILGSQGSSDTLKYIESLIAFDTDKVFVTGGKGGSLELSIQKLIAQHPEYQSKIVCLGSIDDKEMTGLLTRSNVIVKRGGGLCTMEELAIPHNPEEQIILFHHHNQHKDKLSSGFHWEDCNVEEAINELQKAGIQAVKTTPDLALRKLYQAEILLHLQKQSIAFDKDLIADLEKFSLQTLKQCHSWIRDNDLNNFYYYFDPYKIPQNQRDKLNLRTIESLLIMSAECEKHLENIIVKELKKLPNLTQNTLPENPSSLDIKKIIETENLELKSTSRLVSAVNSYKAVYKLSETISPKLTDTPPHKIKNFTKVFNDNATRHDLLSFDDNVIKRFFYYVTYQLAKLFNFNAHFTWFLKPEYKLAGEVDMLNKQPILVH